MVKPELKLQYLDDWMIRWRRFQTVEDFNIELQAQRNRQRNYGCALALAGGISVYTTAPTVIRRYFGPVHFFDFGADVWIKQKLIQFINSRPRYCPNGYGRILIIGVPPYILVSFLQHFDEKARWQKYLNQPTIFGEQARNLEKTGAIEEMLPVNRRASVSPKDQVLFPSAE